MGIIRRAYLRKKNICFANLLSHRFLIFVDNNKIWEVADPIRKKVAKTTNLQKKSNSTQGSFFLKGQGLRPFVRISSLFRAFRNARALQLYPYVLHVLLFAHHLHRRSPHLVRQFRLLWPQRMK